MSRCPNCKILFKYSKAQLDELGEAVEKSRATMSVREACKQAGMGLTTYYSWRNKKLEDWLDDLGGRKR